MEVSNSIQALVSLVDDPDESIFTHVKKELIKHGKAAIPYLENSWTEDLFGNTHQTRIETLIRDINFEETKTQLVKWADSPEKDLLKGAIIISKFKAPDLKTKELYNYFEQLRRDIWLEINNNQTAFEKVKIINRILFDHHGFKGGEKDYSSPVNSFIHNVIDYKEGNPLSLSLVYSILAQSLEVPVYGVNLPSHFILAYMDEEGTNIAINQENEFGTLFYINPYSKGAILNLNEIETFLDKLNLEYRREYFEPCSNTDIIKRMLNNLIGSYQKLNKTQRVNELKELRNLLA